MFDQKFDRKHIKYAWNCCTSEKLFQHLAEFVGNLGQRVDRIENLDLDKYADTIKEIQSDISSLTSSIEKVQTTATGNTEMIVNLLTDLETLTNQVDELAEGTAVEMSDLEQQINDTAGTISDIQILISNIQTKLNTVEDSVDTLDTNTQASLESINERIDSLVTSEEEWHNNIVEQMDDLTDHFGDIEDLVYGFNSDITSMKSDISSLESEISTVTNKCDTLEDEVNKLEDDYDTLDITVSNGFDSVNKEIDTMTNKLDDLISIVNVDSAAAHNAIFRGKYLGTSVTDEQWAAIKAGTFDDMYIGDYWTINGFNWVIADFDYWWRCGDSGYAYTNHHIVIVPSTMLYYNTYMNSSNTTEGGYIGSYMYTTGLADAKTMINSAFGSDHIVNHREYLISEAVNGYPNVGEFVDSTVELMNEEMVCGCPIKQQMPYGGTGVANNTIDKSQLALFRYDRTEFIALGNGSNGGTSGTRYSWWLRDVASTSCFSVVGDFGDVFCDYAVLMYGVRPCFGIY